MGKRVKLFKYISLVLSISFFILTSITTQKAQAEGTALASLEAAYNHMLSGLLGGSPGNRRIYARPDLLVGPVSIDNWKETLHLGSGQGWLFFIDDNPSANWEHGCRYVFVTTGGDFSTVPSTTPPREMSGFTEFTIPPSQPNNHPPCLESPRPASRTMPTRPLSPTTAGR